MCGIVGFVKTKKSNHVEVKPMLDAILHRGPDEQNHYEDTSVILGHTRLSIVDIDGGHQPYLYEDLVLVFNGEIYNHNELREELKSQGYSFNTHSDTEVLLKMYHCYGNNFIDKLNGMYAFVIYNRENKELLISRDFFGIKPLYVYHKGEEFYFSSEVVALIKMLQENKIPFAINPEAQKEYLKEGFISEYPVIENVYEIPRGQLLRFKSKELEQIHTLDFSIQTTASLKQLLIDELKEELDADVDVGVLLSGGIDSSLLTALTSQLKPNISTFSIAFEDTTVYDESRFARQVAKKFHTNHHEFLFNEETLLKYLPKLIEAMDIPMYDPAMLPMLYLSEQVSQKCKVVLSGDGGDELFAGYTHHKVIKYKSILKPISIILDNLKILKKKNKVLKTLLQTEKTLNESLQYDQDTGLNSRLLRKTDLCSMRYGVEVRVPFLSKRIYNYCITKDRNKFINFMYGKLPLRKLVASLVNREIAYKKKQGFRVPIREWVTQGSLGRKIKESLTNELRIDEKVVSRQDITFFLKEKETYYKELFSIYLLNEWLKKTGV